MLLKLSAEHGPCTPGRTDLSLQDQRVGRRCKHQGRGHPLLKKKGILAAVSEQGLSCVSSPHAHARHDNWSAATLLDSPTRTLSAWHATSTIDLILAPHAVKQCCGECFRRRIVHAGCCTPNHLYFFPLFLCRGSQERTRTIRNMDNAAAWAAVDVVAGCETRAGTVESTLREQWDGPHATLSFGRADTQQTPTQ